MQVDWVAFTPATALMGGALIGFAVAMFVLVNGRVVGISGILGGLLKSRAGDSAWRLAFVAGMLAAPLLWMLVGDRPAIRIDASWISLAIAGVLVGYGTRLASGCTSGHGVCGLSRLSPRSLTATIAFMAAGFVTVFIVRHLIRG